jgi:hypothetical protein
MSIDVGSRLGAYEVVALVGEGGMGRVFRATSSHPMARACQQPDRRGVHVADHTRAELEAPFPVGIKMDFRTLLETPPWDWPKGTRNALLDTLRNDRAPESELLFASELAGDLTVIDDALADALLAILRSSDKSEQIRGKAAISLGPVLEYADTEDFDEANHVPITEGTFHRLRESLHGLYLDATVPAEVRRRTLEAAVRAPQAWHRDAVHAAFSSDDEPWRLTAVFCMRYVRGFDGQILEALNDKNAEIHCEAVLAAGTWGIDDAWPHVAALIASAETEKPLLLAAIEAVSSIRPDEAGEILQDLADSDDEDIVAAVDEVMALAKGLSDEDDDFDDDDDDEFPR